MRKFIKDAVQYKYVRDTLRKGLSGPTPRAKLDWKSLHLSPDRFKEPGEWFYTFKIPLGDPTLLVGNGCCYIPQPVSVELDQNSRKLLESEAQVEEFVSDIISKLNSKYAIRIINDWPTLVALGGEIVPSLLTVAQDNDDITSLVLVSQLLGNIAQDTTAKFKNRAASLLCQHCFVRYTEHKISLSWINSSITYYGCRGCGHSRKFIRHNGEVVAVLNEVVKEKYHLQDSMLKVNWLFHRRVFDFDRVEIAQSEDEEVERFAVQLGNDMDKVRQSKYRQMRCTVSSNAHR